VSATVDASWDANTAERYGIPAACNAQGDWGKEKEGGGSGRRRRAAQRRLGRVNSRPAATAGRRAGRALLGHLVGAHEGRSLRL